MVRVENFCLVLRRASCLRSLLFILPGVGGVGLMISGSFMRVYVRIRAESLYLLVFLRLAITQVCAIWKRRIAMFAPNVLQFRVSLLVVELSNLRARIDQLESDCSGGVGPLLLIFGGWGGEGVGSPPFLLFLFFAG